MSYIIYDEKEKTYKVNKRPSNQNSPSVQIKIAKRLKRLVEEDEDLELDDLQKKFVKDIEKSGVFKLKEEKVDIVHSIAISVILDEIVYRMNNPKKGHSKIKKFMDFVLSTNDDPGRQKVKDFFNKLSDPKRKIEYKLADANLLAGKVNKASKNLSPGHASSNRAIKHKRDPKVALHNKKYVETKISKELSIHFNDLIGHDYEPNKRKTSDGKVEYQSSGISSIAKKSFFTPDKTPSPKRKAERADYLLEKIDEKIMKGKNPLNMREYEEVCDIVNYLYAVDTNLYNDLAYRVSALQMKINDEDDEWVEQSTYRPASERRYKDA